MTESFDDYSNYYDLLYKDKNYQEESKYIDDLIKNFSKTNNETLLELGCGTGAHAQYLSKYGYNIYGIDKSKIMIELADTNKNFQCSQGDICSFSLDTKFDNAVSLFHVISYINNNNDLKKAFKNVSNHLKSGGLFIFDVWYTPAVYSIKPSKQNKVFEDHEMKIERNASPDIDYLNNIVKVNYEISVHKKSTNENFSINESHSMRHFSYNEIILLSENYNFELVLAEEMISKNNICNDTWGACFVLRKR
tara:strand:+ start:428 stop:1177 length:750 start_codon:yes stop_codon:yes gene_type:complete